MRLSSRRGFGLLIMVMIIAVSGLILTASMWFLVNEQRQTQLRVDQTKAHYLAQAGVMKACWDWFLSNTTTETSRRWAALNPAAITGNQFFKVGFDGGSTPAYLQSNFAYTILKKDSSSGAGTGTISSVKAVGTNTDKTAATTSLAVTVPAAGVAVNNYLVVYFAMDDNAGVASCADTQGNPYTKISDVTNATHARTMIFGAPVNTALVNGNTITVTYPASTAEAMSVAEFAGVAGYDVQVTATGAVSPGASGNLTNTYANELRVCAIGVEGIIGDTFTPSGSWLTGPPTRVATAGGVAATNIMIDPEYQIVAAVAAVNGNAVITARSWAAAQATFYGSAGWFTSGANRQFRQWQIRNINSANSIILDKIKISWTSPGAELVSGLTLNGTNVWPAATTSASGVTTDLTAAAVGGRTLALNGMWSDMTTFIQWNQNTVAAGAAVTLTCQFIYHLGGTGATTANSDPNTAEIVMWNGAQTGAGLPKEHTFTIMATGQVNQSAAAGHYKVMKTVKAKVSGAPGTNAMEIMDWDEDNQNIP